MTKMQFWAVLMTGTLLSACSSQHMATADTTQSPATANTQTTTTDNTNAKSATVTPVQNDKAIRYSNTPVTK